MAIIRETLLNSIIFHQGDLGNLWGLRLLKDEYFSSIEHNRSCHGGLVELSDTSKSTVHNHPFHS